MNYAAFCALLADRPLPAAVVDLDAVDANLTTLLRALDDRVTMRVASKSVRHPGLLRHLLERGGARTRGLMTFSPWETAWLAEQGFDDLLLAYPVARAPEAAALARVAASGATLLVAVDAADQLDVLEQAAAEADTSLGLCLDVDASWRPLGGAAHLGVRRSPVRSASDALAVAGEIARRPHLELRAVLAYEAQVAGMQDTNAGSRLLDPARAFIKQRSITAVRRLRAEVVDALRGAGHPIAVVNGGGTGSVRSTSDDPAVTEVTVGSGFLCPHLFDGYHGLSLQPAAFFALPVTRSSDPGFVTCAGGGLIASGAIGADRAPVVHLPPGLAPIGLEGWGEVQTPLKVTARSPQVGDPVICRHAKAGELAEHFDRYLLVRGGEVVEESPTYRALGVASTP